MTFANLALLAGLGFLIVPPVIHLFHRRKFDVVDWAAMQFLEVSQRTRRKIFLEELLLMALRMVVLAVLVLALAAPKSNWGIWRGLAPRPSRDVVIVVDGSLSMGYTEDGQSRHDRAVEWCDRYLSELRGEDRVALVHARQKPLLPIPLLSSDLALVRETVRHLPAPRGGVNWPEAVQAAIGLFEENGKQREIILVTDGQAHGWADEKTLVRWDLLAHSVKWDEKAPRLWVVDLAPDKPATLPNWSLNSLTATRPLVPVGREVTFKAELQLSTATPSEAPAGSSSPKSIRIEVDGRQTEEHKPFNSVDTRGRLPFSFVQRFSTAGSHRVTVRIDDDVLPGDNVADYSIDVTSAIPVLILEGDATARHPSSSFLRDALAPIRDPNPGFLLRTIPVAEFVTSLLQRPLGADPNTVPQVVILSNPGRLTADQAKGIEEFLQEGGGVLVTLGDRADARQLNDVLFRDGKGWLPAKLLDIVGDEKDLEKAAQIVPQSLEHPALELFKEADPGSLASAYFPRHWRLEVPTGGLSSIIASLNNRLPLFAEKTVGKGRIILSAVPLDHSWRTNLTDLGDFVRLSHEMAYYLAGSRSSEKNLQAGQAIVFTPNDGEAPGLVTVLPPEGPPAKIEARKWPLIYEETKETGCYELQTASGKSHYFVVNSDPGESNLSPWTEADRRKLGKLLPALKYVSESNEIDPTGSDAERPMELWWIFMLLLVGLMCFEIFLTRRIALRNPPSES
jgi:hypothetical protein